MVSNQKETINLNPPSLGSQDFFVSVYRHYFHKLYMYSKVICRSSDIAKDVVSDLFYELWNKKTNLSEILNLEAYLLVSVRNKTIKALSSNSGQISDESLEIIKNSIEYINPEELLLEKELKAALDNIVQKLPEHCQLIYLMAKEQSMKYSEIATKLGISIETVKTQLKRAQIKLRKSIEEHYREKKNTHIMNVHFIGQQALIATLCFFNIFSQTRIF